MLKSIPKLLGDGLTFLQALSKDKIDSIRVSAAESIVFQIYDPKSFVNILWPILKNMFEDPSWRVRYAVLLQIGDVTLLSNLRFVSQQEMIM